MIDREKIFREIQSENWEYLIDVIHKNKNDISSDPILKSAAETFIAEFLFKVSATFTVNVEMVGYLELMYMIHIGGFYKLDDNKLKVLVCEIVKNKQDKLSEAYGYAKLYPNEKICQQTIHDYEKLIPERIEHSLDNRIIVTKKKDISNVNFRRNLFKSNQEIQFFYALKKTFDSYQIYPNVAVSCLINWDFIKEELNHEERDYFFKSIVDFVIFDQAEGFIPIYFFEIDSDFHDLKEQKKKDSIKDAIFSKAGIQIIRIRKQDRTVNEQDFIKLIRELIN